MLPMVHPFGRQPAVQLRQLATSAMGNYIVISHGNGVCTVYEHCSSLYVSEGDYVSQGQTIAAVGSTGISTGAHLHFGVTVGGEYVNPLYYVSP